MPAERVYFDTSYLVRLYLEDRGFMEVRTVADAASEIVSAWHAQAEVWTALHRGYREGRFSKEAFTAAARQFVRDRDDGLFRWLALTDRVQHRLEEVVIEAGNEVFVRAADALHLSCAAEHGFQSVYSNDRRFLEAAPLFGLEGRDVLVS